MKTQNVPSHNKPSFTSSKKHNKCRAFHFRYLELCRAKNLTPLPEIRSKNNATALLELYGDKLGVNEWLLIIEALHYDQVLQTLSLRMRRCHSTVVLDHLDTEKKAKLFKQKPVVYTKFIFSGLVEAVSNCVEFNKNLRILKMEGLPLHDKYIESIAKALSSNESLVEISFQRSIIGDKGCEAICNTVKYLNHVEKLELCDCNLTTKGAEYVADMIKMQKISRYTEGWEKSLRYRDVDMNTISGLRLINLARNPQIGDDGVRVIAEVLKEDAWLKIIDMENCGLTDRGANIILDCLDLNSAITDFNIRNNDGVSKFLMRSIRDHLGKDDEDKSNDPHYVINAATGIKSITNNRKLTIAQLIEHCKTLEEQLAFERTLRKKAEQLNEKLNMQIMSFESKLGNENNTTIPEGYVVVKNESLQSIIKERNDFHKLVNSVCTSPETTPRTEIVTMRHRDVSSTPTQYEETVEEEEEVTSSVETTDSRKVLKVRKVKSEMKYMEPPQRDTTKKRESKSDHEFANERDFNLNSTVQVETNIGDTTMSMMKATQRNNEMNLNLSSSSQLMSEQTTYMETLSMSHNMNFINNKIIDIDELSLNSTRGSDLSSDSDTIRNPREFSPMKVFMRRKHIECGQGEGGVPPQLSPHNMFLGRQGSQVHGTN